MKIAVSACLLGENCKYNGGNNLNRAVLQYVSGHEVLPLCPECLGGLPVPRPPAEIVNGTVQTAEGTSVNAAFRLGAARALDAVRAAEAELVILQPRSPSCGLGQVYDGSFTKTLIEGDGVFGALLRANGIPAVTSENLPDKPINGKCSSMGLPEDGFKCQ